MTQSSDNGWQSMKMRVGAEILKNLSSGIYSNPGNTIKELINNSYDADATDVTVRARPEFDTISITDNGFGMNEEEFKNNFTIVSRSRKRDAGLLTPNLHRPIIGKIGIGFISALQICDEATFVSKKAGEILKLEANVDFGKFKGVMAKKADFQDISDVRYRVVAEDRDAHYTMVIMTKLTRNFKELLLDKDLKGIDIINFDGLTFEQVMDQIDRKIESKELEDFGKEKGLKAIGQYWQMLLQIANAVPVPYLRDGPVKKPDNYPVIRHLRKEIDSLGFDVDFDGIHLKKPLRFPNVSEISKKRRDYDVYPFTKKCKFEDKSVLRFHGYLFNQRKSILPTQFRGIVIRIKHVAIGGFFPDFLDYPYSEKLYLPWTSGEIEVEEGLEDAMNINRNTFDITHPHYRELRIYLHALLHTKVFVKARERYDRRKEERKKLEEEEREQRMKDLTLRRFGHLFRVFYSEELDPQNAIDIQVNNRKLIIYRHHAIFRRNKQRRGMVEEILLLFETAFRLGSRDARKLRQIFYEELERW